MDDEFGMEDELDGSFFGCFFRRLEGVVYSTLFDDFSGSFSSTSTLQ